MPRFETTTTVPHPLDTTFEWHRRPGAFTRLTPPGLARVVAGPTDGIAPGSRVTVRVTHPIVPGVGGMVPIVGDALRERVGVDLVVEHGALRDPLAIGFEDHLIEPEIADSRHEHRFAAVEGDGGSPSTRVTDHLEWQLPPGLALAARSSRRRVAELFAFRRRQLTADLALHAQLGAPRLRIGITGASGTVGTQLAALAESGGHEVVRFVRGGSERRAAPGESVWDPRVGTVDHDVLASLDAVVHLAGESIGGRFTRERKQRILESRIEATSTIVNAIARIGADAPTLVQASAIGGYGARRPGELLTEDSALGDGFLADVVRDWESAARPAVEAGVRTVFVRTGLVLTSGPGSLLPQLPLFVLGAGGRMTRPERMVSWITLDDLVHLYLFAIATPTVEGPINAVAPDAVTSAQFAEVLGRVLRRPSALPVPRFGPWLVLGREGADQLVETDQHVSSARAEAAGIEFAHPRLPGALRHVLVRGSA